MAFPTTIPTRESLYDVINDWRAKLVSDINNTQSSISVTTAAVGGNSIPDSGVLSIGSEIIKYSGINSAGVYPILLNCVRGYDGTVAKAWGAGADVELRWVATHHNILADTLMAIMQSMGAAFLDASQQLGAGSWPNLKTKLDATLPKVVGFTNQTSWIVEHTRRRVVLVQIYEEIAADQYRRIDAPITQEVDASGISRVIIDPFPAPISGHVVIS